MFCLLLASSAQVFYLRQTENTNKYHMRVLHRSYQAYKRLPRLNWLFNLIPGNIYASFNTFVVNSKYHSSAYIKASCHQTKSSFC